MGKINTRNAARASKRLVIPGGAERRELRRKASRDHFEQGFIVDKFIVQCFWWQESGGGSLQTLCARDARGMGREPSAEEKKVFKTKKVN